MSKKPFIFFCDDKKKWTDQFKERHGHKFEIETINENGRFTQRLNDLIRQGRTPDIILIDLYHPHNMENSDERKKLEDEGEEAITTLKNAIKKAKDPINKAWVAAGFTMLRQARGLCPNIPIAIYTEQGLTLAGNEELRDVSDSKGEWFLKGQDVCYEEYKLDRMLVANINDKITKHTLWILSAIIIIAALTYSLVIERRIDYVISFGATLVSLSIAIMPYIISFFVRKERKKN